MTRSAVALVRLASPLTPPTSDAELLRSFVAARGEDAFTELVRRHGPMVLAVCRRVLSHSHDAEDAFQAVFLVLARKANTVRSANLAGWLYGVAVRTARGVRVMRNRRQKHAVRREVASRSQKSGISDDASLMESAPDSALLLAEQAAIIDEELAKLPEQYRDAIVVCELRGLSRKDAAAELGIPEGTLSSRLAAAKRKLSVRLAARGLASTVMLGAALAPATVSAALEQSTALAVRGLASNVAQTVASTVLKGMLFDQLKAVVLATGLLLTGVCGGLAMTGSPDSPPGGNAATSPSSEDPAAKLVKQLGSEDYGTREAVAKELHRLGSKAEPALRAGLKSDDPEIRTRCAAILGKIRKNALDDFANKFDPKSEKLPDHPIWKRFKALAGDTPASRALFARIIKNTEWRQRLDSAETGPEAAGRQYREAVSEVGRIVHANSLVGFVIYVWPCDPAAQTAYLLFLGSFPGTQTVEETGADAQYLLSGEHQLIAARGLRLGLQDKEIAPGSDNHYHATAALTPGSDRVFAKLLGEFLTHRSEQNLVYYGMTSAVTYHAAEVLPVARTIAADKTRAKITRCTALIAVAQFGTTTDLPLFKALFDETAIVASREPSVPPGAKPPPTITAQVADESIALALLLCDQDPFEYGFTNAENLFQRENGRPVIAHYETLHFGFSDENARAAAHAKAKAFLAKQNEEPKKEEPKPTLPPAKLVEQLGSEEFAEREAAQKQLKELGSKARTALETGLKSQNPEIVKRCGELLDHLTRVEFYDRHWPRFAKVIGDDKASRALFERIRSNRRNVELLDAIAADPKAASKLYHDRWTELNKAARIERGPGSYTLASAQLAEVVGWMYLGTFPGAEGGFRTSYSLDFLPFFPLDKDPPGGLYDVLKHETVAPPLRRLIGKWTAARIDYSGRAYGFQLALQFDIKEVLPAARETLTTVVKDDPYPGNTTRNIGYAMLVIGKLGSKDDLPLLEKFATNEDVCAVCLIDPPLEPGEPHVLLQRPPKDGQDATGQLRDVSAAMRLHLLGENPDAFGFYWQPPGTTDRKPVKLDERFSLYSIGFIRNADRITTLKKAKEWFDKQKK